MIRILFFCLILISPLTADIDVVDNPLNIEQKKTTTTIYDDYIIVQAKDHIKLFNNNLSLEWEQALTQNTIEQFELAFKSIYILDNNQNFYKMDLNVNLKEKITYLPKFNFFEIQYPYLLANTEDTSWFFSRLRPRENIMGKRIKL